MVLTRIPVVLLAVRSGPAAAGERVFADTCWERESGDMAGTIITLRGAKPMVALQWTEGALNAPVAAGTVRRTGPRLAFTLVTAESVYTFAGRLGRHRLSGVLATPWQVAQQVVLPERSRKSAENPATCH